jgi:thioredoxin:protein disulfide reductase
MAGQHGQYAPHLAEPAVRPLPVSRLVLAGLCLLALLLSLPARAELKSFSSAANHSSFLKAGEAFRLESSATPEGLQLQFRVTPGYYLYLDRFHFTAESSGLEVGKPVFASAGEWKDDPTFGRVHVFHEDVLLTLPLTGNGQVKVVWQGCADAGLCYPPQEQIVSFGTNTVRPELVEGQSAPEASLRQAQGERVENSGHLTQLFIMFALGLGLAFTPCVLPMLPILAGIIARQHTSSALRGFLLALSYVVGVGAVYAAMGFVVGFFGQQINLPGLFQQPMVLIIFALLFLALALSLFGLYELRLPAALHSHFDSMSRRPQGGALVGSFLIGTFSALVVSPCVSAPLFGVLLHISATGDAVFGALSLFLLALGMGVPLLVLGATEGRLLPKAGAWMNEVKFFFGLMLLFVAAELLTRMTTAPVALALYSLCTAATGLWLWRMSRTGNALQLLLRAFAFCVLVYAAALVGGAASGGDDPLRPLAQFSSQPHAATATPFVRVKNNAELDVEIAKATAEGKALMLDFYADWCVSCKVMERKVFRNPAVAARLSQLHLVQADVTANNADDRALLKRFSLLGPPTILFFDKNGNELSQARLVGEKNVREFLAHLDEYGL